MANHVSAPDLDVITRRLSAFGSFQELLDAKGNYRPTILLTSDDHRILARAYNAAQEHRDDPRRAFTGSNPRNNTLVMVGDSVTFHHQNGWRRGVVVTVGPKRAKVSFSYKYDFRIARAEKREPTKRFRFFSLTKLVSLSWHGSWREA